MRHPEVKCGNCQAYESTGDNPEMGYCHRQSIKGHAIQEMPKLDLRINAQVTNEPKYKIVPSFPPTLARLWCMEIALQPAIHEKLRREALMTDDEKAEEGSLNS